MTLVYSELAKKQLTKLDASIQKKIKKYLSEIVELENPRLRGKGLTSNLSGYWRYRVGDYRIICEIKDNELILYALEIGHRKEIYK